MLKISTELHVSSSGLAAALTETGIITGPPFAGLTALVSYH